MGRKGMKGFMKFATRPSSKEDAEEAAAEQQAAAPPAAGSKSSSSSSSSQPKPAEPDSTSKAAGSDSETEGQDGKESRSKMLQRHKREMLAHKKAVQRMGKKSKDELAKLDADIEARHAQELQQLDAAAAAAAAAAPPAVAAAAGGAAAKQQAAAAANGSAAAADKASKYLVDLSIGDEEPEDAEQKGKKTTKAQKRREKLAAKQAERDARIAAELEAAGPSERETEEAALKALLAPLGLGIKEIRADGHCLYRSLEDQLETTAAAAAAADEADAAEEPAGLLNYQELRELAAEHMRQHKDQFAPFLLPEDESEDPEQHYEKYCFTLETTAAWGGHLELTALAAALQRQIKVHAVGMPTVTIGDEFAGEGKAPALEVCYVRHAFGLGEHYNSTKKARFVRFSIEGEDGEQAAGDTGDKQQQQQQGEAEDETANEQQEEQ